MIDCIVRGTTPTIKYTFSVVSPADITSAYLNVKQDGQQIMEKTLAEATVTEHTIEWGLSQQETLSMTAGKTITYMLNWLAGDVRGASEKSTVPIEDNYKDVII